MFRASLILTTAAIASGSNIRGELSSLASLPKAHARLTIENFNHQRVNPSSLSYHLFTDERGEESDIYKWSAKNNNERDTLTLTNFDRDVLTFVRANTHDVDRLEHVQHRRDVLTTTPIALDTSSRDQKTNEGSIGTLVDRSIEDVRAAAELHDVQQAPYIDEDARGVILAREVRARRNIHVQGGRYLIVDSSDIVVDNVRQWKIVVDETFDGRKNGGDGEMLNVISGWKGSSKHHVTEDNKRGRCGVNVTPRTDWFLGPYGSAEVEKIFQLPSDHTRVRFNVNFHFFDNWSDETAYLKINGKMVWQQGHSMCGSLSVIPDFPGVCQSKGVNACVGAGSDRMGVMIRHEQEYFSNEMIITFGATLEKGNDATWGVDDLQISVL